MAIGSNRNNVASMCVMPWRDRPFTYSRGSNILMGSLVDADSHTPSILR